jgi:anti-anti-sigma factor
LNDPLRLEEHRGVTVGRLSGEVDAGHAPSMRDRLYRALGNHDEGLVIDLSEATYIDSAIVNLLFELAERLGMHQLRLAVVVPEGGLVERVIAIVNLGMVTDLKPTLDDAVEAVQSSS